MTPVRAVLALLVSMGVALACAAPPPARLRVEVLRGFPASAPEPAVSASRVEVLLDLTRSMREPTAAGPERFRAAQAAASRLVQELPDAAGLGLTVLGLEAGPACSEPRRVAGPGSDATRAALAQKLGGLEPRGEGSLAAGLERVQQQLAQEGVRHGARVVAITDLGAECGGDLCAAAASLVAAGVPLDLMLLGEAPVPACLAGLAPVQALAPGGTAMPALRVVSADADGPAVVTGRADGSVVLVPAGSANLVVELDPPLQLERGFAPGADLRLRILDFPALDPPVREWHWKEGPARKQAAGPERVEAAQR